MRHHRGWAVAAGLIALCCMLSPAIAGATTPGGISGRVTSASTDEAVEGAEVCAIPAAGEEKPPCVYTNPEGKYEIKGLAPGEYKVEFTGKVCVGEICERVYAGKPYPFEVDVSSGATRENVNAELAELAGKISGQVTSGGVPVEGILVCAQGSGSGCRETGPGGEYTIEGLMPGRYRVSFKPRYACGAICQPATNYVSQYWNGQSALEAAGVVTVRAGKITAGIDAELQVGGHISGRVVSASIYAQPIADLKVCAIPTATDKEGAKEGEVVCALTNGNGEYAISALASGGYEVEFTGETCMEAKGAGKCTHPYISQTFQAVVTVGAPGTTSAIDGALVERSPAKPVNTGAPTLTGTAAAGQTLSCSTGGWAGNPTSLAYRWLRGGVAIAGQSANTYTVQSADQGAGIACEVIASNGAGASASISNTVQIPRPAAGLAVLQSASVRGGTVSVTLRCTGASACSGVIRITTSIRHGHEHARTLTIGLASFSMVLGGNVTLRVHLTGMGRKLLSRAGRRGLRVKIAGSGVQAQVVVLKTRRRR